MENKYYTPKIEEFHVGFEYEFAFNKKNYTKIVYDGSQVLKSKSYYDDYGCEYDAVEDDLKYCRVKYLDKEDIESFGFECSDSDVMEDVHECKKKHKGFDILLLQYQHTKVVSIFRGVGEKLTPIFGGLIKNKSELKKILQMTGVL